MSDKLLLKTYLYILFTLSKCIESLPPSLFTLNDFLYLLLTPNFKNINTKDFLQQIEDYFGFHIEIGNTIQSKSLYIDETILIRSLSFILKPIEKNIFSVHYEETQEGGFLIPNLIFFTLSSLDKVSTFTLINDLLPIEYVFINDQWTRATNGGKIQIKDNRIVFRLAGLKLPEKKNDIVKDIIPDFISKSVDEVENFIEKNLLGWNLNKLIDVQASFNSIWNYSKYFIRKNEKIEVNIETSLPILKLPELSFSSILLCAISPFFICTYPKAGILDINYDTKNKNLIIETITKTDTYFEYPESIFQVLNYIIRQLNGKIISETKQVRNDYVFSMNINIPDEIGNYLDNELSGWNYLSLESKDLLRRLSSGFSIPYENPLISEILRYEVETNFHDIFTLPLFINLAHEVVDRDKKNMSATLKSILIDIEKGKIKKKSLNPVIVGQIIESFLNLPNGEERISKYFSNDTTFSIPLFEFAQALKKFPQSAKQLLPLLVSFLQQVKR